MTVNVLDKLKRLVGELNQHANEAGGLQVKLEAKSTKPNVEMYLSCMKRIGEILKETDISSFEMIHSGLIESLAKLVTVKSSKDVVCFEQQVASLKNKVKPGYLADFNRVLGDEQRVFISF